jgi:DNA ligase-associated metallophosphoesterase
MNDPTGTDSRSISPRRQRAFVPVKAFRTRVAIRTTITRTFVTGRFDIELAGRPFQLLAEHGVFWPEQAMLFVADPHFGKEATFRAHGIPVPVGSTDATLAKIAKMLDATRASGLCILGDMFHAPSSLSRDVCRSLEQFFVEFTDVAMMLVRGNHDAHVGQLPKRWPIEIVEPGHTIQRLALGHHPGHVPGGADLYLCGHLHPAIRLASRPTTIGKVPCFWHSKGCLVLPAIGDFTGTHVVQLSEGDNAWIVAEDEIYKFNGRRRSNRFLPRTGGAGRP